VTLKKENTIPVSFTIDMYNPPLPVRIQAEAEVSHLPRSEFSRIPGIPWKEK